jgi:hypothetical protein
MTGEMVSSVGQVQPEAAAARDEVVDRHEVEITTGAICGYGRLLRAVGRTIKTHPAGDGGLICEDRTVPARPMLWRVSPEGAVLPDRPYSFITRAFTSAKLPGELATR